VAEDENGEGIVVQIIETLAKMESLVLAKSTITGYGNRELE